MAAYGHPGPPGRDAHGLVVVAPRPTGREGVPEPELVLIGDGVGQVREGGRPPVGRDHQVRVRPIPGHHPARMDHLPGDQIVGDVEQGPNERLVGRLNVLGGVLHHLRREAGPAADETALGPGGNDDGVLLHLREGQIEHLGAEVVGPLAPAQPAPGDQPGPQVNALDRRSVHEGLHPRAGGRQIGHGRAVQLEGQHRPVPALGVDLEVVGAQGGVDEPQIAPQDLVLLEVPGPDSSSAVQRARSIVSAAITGVLPAGRPSGGAAHRRPGRVPDPGRTGPRSTRSGSGPRRERPPAGRPVRRPSSDVSPCSR